jgi:hypothetical protein
LADLGAGEQLVAESPLDDAHEAPMLRRVGVERAHRAQLGDPQRL